MVALLDRGPGNAKGGFLLAWVAVMFFMGAVEGRPENILCVFRQMVADGRGQLFID
jgi:hypothetical protein